MSKHVYVRLSDTERAELDSLIRSGHASVRTITRARILLLADKSPQEQPDERDDEEIASALLCHRNTVGNIRRRVVAGGLSAALYDKPRPGQKPKITGDVEARLTLLACSQPPEGRDRWTLQLLADRMVALGYVESISDTT